VNSRRTSFILRPKTKGDHPGEFRPGAKLSASAWLSREEHPLLHGRAEVVDASGDHVIESDSDSGCWSLSALGARPPGHSVNESVILAPFAQITVDKARLHSLTLTPIRGGMFFVLGECAVLNSSESFNLRYCRAGWSVWRKLDNARHDD
jgi:hypothetical protein